jgi:hypothetical protein
MYITEVIVTGEKTREEIAEMFDIGENEVAYLQKCNDIMVNDENVSEEEYQEWCDEVDSRYEEIK